MEIYHLLNSKVVLGDLKNALSINTFILITKKIIYYAMKKEQVPHLANMKNDIKNFHFQKKI